MPGPLSEALRADGAAVAPYLRMLHLTGEDGDRAVAFVREVLAAYPPDALEEEAVALLDEANWRFHLVAAVAVVLGLRSPRLDAAVWEAFDRGSWVAPQLAATALIADADFAARARVRLDAAAGLGAKAAGALVALAELTPALAGWVARRRAQ
ncbi:MAG TPA: hypothetical protein VGQ83_22305, partial [Polyangia bacterium]